MIRTLRRMVVLGLAILSLTLAGVILAAWQMERRHGDGRSLEAPVDAIIVLGAGIDPDGVLNFATRRRVGEAVALLAAGKANRLIMTGGRPGWRKPPIGAQMRDLAVAMGAPETRVLVEDQASTTFENIRFSVPIARAAGAERIALLTDHFHLMRADLLARALTGQRFALVSADGMEHQHKMDQAKQLLRETLAWWYNLGKVAAWWSLGALGYSEAERAAWIE